MNRIAIVFCAGLMASMAGGCAVSPYESYGSYSSYGPDYYVGDGGYYGNYEPDYYSNSYFGGYYGGGDYGRRREYGHRDGDYDRGSRYVGRSDDVGGQQGSHAGGGRMIGGAQQNPTQPLQSAPQMQQPVLNGGGQGGAGSYRNSGGSGNVTPPAQNNGWNPFWGRNPNDPNDTN
jgi:hypothetical protein